MTSQLDISYGEWVNELKRASSTDEDPQQREFLSLREIEKALNISTRKARRLIQQARDEKRLLTKPIAYTTVDGRKAFIPGYKIKESSND